MAEVAKALHRSSRGSVVPLSTQHTADLQIESRSNSVTKSRDYTWVLRRERFSPYQLLFQTLCFENRISATLHNSFFFF